MVADNYNRDLRDTLEAIIELCQDSPDPRGELHQQVKQLRGGQFSERDIGRIICEAKRRLQL